jgi:hypothetical protein
VFIFLVLTALTIFLVSNLRGKELRSEDLDDHTSIQSDQEWSFVSKDSLDDVQVIQREVKVWKLFHTHHEFKTLGFVTQESSKHFFER